MTRKEKLHIPPSVTVDVVLFTIHEGKLKVLLIHRTGPPYKKFRALPGGFVLHNETTEKAARRIIKEKAGVSHNVYLEQLYTFDEVKRDPRGRVISITYFALVHSNKLSLPNGKDLQDPALHPARALPARIAFDHRKIISYGLKRLQYKLEYTNVVYSLLPKEFTLTALQSIYEAILGKGIDKRNFRKKFLALGLIRKTQKKLSGGQHRPAVLYRFVSLRPQELKRFF